jgi:hypothetical protein
MKIPMTAAICGFCIMSMEMLGARIMQPTFGFSIDLWAALISTFIASLSVGYWLGGVVADKETTKGSLLGKIILTSSVSILLLTAVGHAASQAVGAIVGVGKLGILTTAIILFFPPSLLLGMTSPMLLKFAFKRDLGKTSGRLWAISASGNVCGILATDYWLMPNLTTQNIMLIIAATLAMLGSTLIFWPIAVASKSEVQ